MANRCVAVWVRRSHPHAMSLVATSPMSVDRVEEDDEIDRNLIHEAYQM
jgi:hypothetical protein